MGGKRNRDSQESGSRHEGYCPMSSQLPASSRSHVTPPSFLPCLPAVTIPHTWVSQDFSAQKRARGEHQLLRACSLPLPPLCPLSHGCCSLIPGPGCGGSGESQGPQGPWVGVAVKRLRE